MNAICVAKSLIFIFGLLSLIGGIFLIIIGTLKLVNFNLMDSDLGFTPIVVVPLGIIVNGAIIIFISFFGCSGAIIENTCMIVTYVVMMFTLFILQLAFIIGIFCFLKILHFVQKEINKSLSRMFVKVQNSDVYAEALFFNLQQTMRCCGVNGPEDWYNSTVPESCCQISPEPCIIDHAYGEGCAYKTFDDVVYALVTFGYISIGLVVVELIAAVLAICLANRIIYCVD